MSQRLRTVQPRLEEVLTSPAAREAYDKASREIASARRRARALMVLAIIGALVAWVTFG